MSVYVHKCQAAKFFMSLLQHFSWQFFRVMLKGQHASSKYKETQLFHRTIAVKNLRWDDVLLSKVAFFTTQVLTLLIQMLFDMSAFRSWMFFKVIHGARRL